MSRPPRIEIECTYCLQRFRVAPHSHGKSVQCPLCGFVQVCVLRTASSPADYPGDSPAPSEATFVHEGISSTGPVAVPAASAEVKPEETDVFSREEKSPPRGEQSAQGDPLCDGSRDLFRPGGVVDRDHVAESAKEVRAPSATGPSDFSLVSDLERGRRGWGEEFIVFPRANLLWLGVFWGFLALAAFGLGYLVGTKHSGTASGEGGSALSGRKGAVLVEGRVYYRPDPLRGLRDTGAVAIFLPRMEQIPERIPTVGLRPFEASEMRGEGPKAIARLDGVFEIAGEDGSFLAVLPRVGKYYVLLLSRHAERPTGEAIAEADLIEMRRYFLRPEDVIGRSKYLWRLVEFSDSRVVLEHNFGLDKASEQPLLEMGASFDRN